jgi:hypothetical protein
MIHGLHQHSTQALVNELVKRNPDELRHHEEDLIDLYHKLWPVPQKTGYEHFMETLEILSEEE